MKSAFVLGSLIAFSQCAHLKQQNYYIPRPIKPVIVVQKPTTTSTTAGSTHSINDNTSQQLPQGGMQSTSSTKTNTAYTQRDNTGYGQSPIITSSSPSIPVASTSASSPSSAPAQPDLFALLATAALQSNNNANSNLNSSLLSSLFKNLPTNFGANSLGSNVNSNTATTNSQNIVVSTTASDHSNANTNMDNKAISTSNNGLSPSSTYSNTSNNYLKGYDNANDYSKMIPAISSIPSQNGNSVSSNAAATNSQSAAVSTSATGNSNASTNLTNTAASSNLNGINSNYSSNSNNNNYRESPQPQDLYDPYAAYYGSSIPVYYN